MKISGKWFRDANFTYVFADDKIYTIAKNTGDWGYVAVGGTTYWGKVLDKNTYNHLAMLADGYGTFNLKGEF